MPLFNVVLGFDLSAATALSQTTISFSAIASSLYGLTQPSPHDGRFPLADLDIALLFMPALLFGVSFGMPYFARSKAAGVFKQCASRQHLPQQA